MRRITDKVRDKASSVYSGIYNRVFPRVSYADMYTDKYQTQAPAQTTTATKPAAAPDRGTWRVDKGKYYYTQPSGFETERTRADYEAERMPLMSKRGATFDTRHKGEVTFGEGEMDTIADRHEQATEFWRQTEEIRRAEMAGEITADIAAQRREELHELFERVLNVDENIPEIDEINLGARTAADVPKYAAVAGFATKTLGGIAKLGAGTAAAALIPIVFGADVMVTAMNKRQNTSFARKTTIKSENKIREAINQYNRGDLSEEMLVKAFETNVYNIRYAQAVLKYEARNAASASLSDAVARQVDNQIFFQSGINMYQKEIEQALLGPNPNKVLEMIEYGE